MEYHSNGRSLQKVQGHRAGVVLDMTPRTGGPVGHGPNPVALREGEGKVRGARREVRGGKMRGTGAR